MIEVFFGYIGLMLLARAAMFYYNLLEDMDNNGILKKLEQMELTARVLLNTAAMLKKELSGDFVAEKKKGALPASEASKIIERRKARAIKR